MGITRVVTITPTVEWRYPANLAMQKTLGAQSRKPEERIEFDGSSMGCGARWRIIAEWFLTAETLIVHIDDDLILPPDYIEKCVEVSGDRPDQLCQWNYEWNPAGQSHTPVWFAGGVCFYRANLLIGLLEDELAMQHLGPDYIDDGTMSAWFWKRKIRLTQLSTDKDWIRFHELAEDPRSIKHRVPREAREANARVLQDAWGWPGADQVFGESGAT